MENLIKWIGIIIGMAIASFAFTGCDDDDKQPTLTELDKLPPLTFTGENTFGCLIDSVAFTTSIVYSVYQNDFLLTIGGRIQSDLQNNTDMTVSMVTRSTVNSGDTFLLNVEGVEDGSSWGSYTTINDDTVCGRETNDVNTGRLAIEHIDKENFIISGTFNFIACTQDCDTVRITDGRFDLRYTP